MSDTPNDKHASQSHSFDMNAIDGRLRAMYTNDKDKEQSYDEWANKYDNDLINELAYVAHIDAARIFSELDVDREARILDVACGTGLVGEELSKLGFSHIDGTDFSNGMIAVAQERGIYGTLFRHDFTEALPTPHQYDAVICVGLFSFSIPRIEHMHHVVNAVKPGGQCLITVNGAAWRELDLAPSVEAESEKHGFVIERIETSGYIRQEGIDARVLIIRMPSELTNV